MPLPQNGLAQVEGDRVLEGHCHRSLKGSHLSSPGTGMGDNRRNTVSTLTISLTGTVDSSLRLRSNSSPSTLSFKLPFGMFNLSDYHEKDKNRMTASGATSTGCAKSNRSMLQFVFRRLCLGTDLSMLNFSGTFSQKEGVTVASWTVDSIIPSNTRCR